MEKEGVLSTETREELVGLLKENGFNAKGLAPAKSTGGSLEKLSDALLVNYGGVLAFKKNGNKIEGLNPEILKMFGSATCY